MRSKTLVIATAVAIAAVAAVAATGCGDTKHATAATATATAGAAPAVPPHHAAPNAPAERAAPNLVVFRRFRYEGATLRALYLHPDGTFRVDVPGGGAGGATVAGELAARTLATVRRQIADVPWGHLSKRHRVYNRSGAYFLITHSGAETTAMADGMSVDLLPLVRTLDGVITGDGVAHQRVTHRYYTR